MERDLIGYGARSPRPQWKSKNGRPAKMVIQFVINYEEGGEHCILNGDDRSEWLLSEIVGGISVFGRSAHEYGVAVRIWFTCWFLASASFVC